MKAFRLLLVAYEQLDLVRGLAFQGRDQRQILHGEKRFSIGFEDAVFLGPFMDVLFPRVAAHPHHARIVEKGHHVLVEGDHALAHAVEHGFQEPGEAFVFPDDPLQTGLRLPVPAFPLVQGEGGQDGQVQLALVEGHRHVAEGSGRLRPLQQVFPGFVDQVRHRNAEPAPDPLACFRAGELPFQPQVDQGQVGRRGRGFLYRLAAAGNRGAHPVPEVLQALLQVCGNGFVPFDDQYLRVGHALRFLCGLFVRRADSAQVRTPVQIFRVRPPFACRRSRGRDAARLFAVSRQVLPTSSFPTASARCARRTLLPCARPASPSGERPPPSAATTP